MTQVITQATESAGVPRNSTGLSARLGRAADWFLSLRNRDGLIRPDSLSRHTLRDIGLAEDVRANHLLGDAWMRR